MSDLYLVLRNRLEAVPEWVYIASEALTAARNRRGYSYETTARELHVSSKSWERYEKAGRIPRSLLPRVAEVLDLEIEEQGRSRVVATSGTQLDRIEDKLDSLDAKVSLLVPAERLADLEAARAEVAAAHESVDDQPRGGARSQGA